MTPSEQLRAQLATIIYDVNMSAGSRVDKLMSIITQELKEAERVARINSLLDLEQWAKLHDLDAEMILDGIEHMVKSIIQVPDQPYKDHTERIKALTPTNKKEIAE